MRINRAIKSDPIFLIDQQNQIHKSIALSEAQQMAMTAGLDLVEVNPTSQPPVCKILDYGQYLYQINRQQQTARQKSKKVELKNIRLTFRIGKGDILTRQKQATKFIERGDIVRVELFLRGREKEHGDLAIKIVQDFVTTMPIPVKLDQPVMRKGPLISTQFSKK